MKRLPLIAALALTLALAAPLAAQDAAPATPDSVVATASAEEWIAINPEDVLIMELSPAADGSGRYVVIQLLPPPFSQPWVDNIRTLARAHWWDGTSVYRVVDNWVAQWGGGDPDFGMDPGPMPTGVVMPQAAYENDSRTLAVAAGLNAMEGAVEQLLRRMTGQAAAERPSQVHMRDAYAERTLFISGWPIAASDSEALAWPIHCYGHVGVARETSNTGTGSELYAVIGHAPRQLDRNIAVVGRVIEGIEHLATLPRGTGEAGVYETRAEDTPIVAARLASEHPDGATFRYQYLDTASETFARYVAVRANRNDAFYTVPAGGVDICNVQVPVRLVTD